MRVIDYISERCWFWFVFFFFLLLFLLLQQFSHIILSLTTTCLTSCAHILSIIRTPHAIKYILYYIITGNDLFFIQKINIFTRHKVYRTAHFTPKTLECMGEYIIYTDKKKKKLLNSASENYTTKTRRLLSFSFIL